MIRKHFRIRRIVLGLAFAAIAVPVAQAKPVSEISGHGGTTPTMAQLEAQAAAYSRQSSIRSGHGGTTPTMAQLEAQAAAYQRLHRPIASEISVQSTLTPLQVEGLRWQAMADTFQSQSPVRSVISTSPTSGFDWSDAGIGASVAFGAALMLLTAVGLGRRHRRTLASA
jgi:hypothetical protein